uniref:Uncharacterized protein n=1 Tax=Anopheles melas TaxID=34690 RepID=A0A182U3Z5_9DIPT
MDVDAVAENVLHHDLGLPGGGTSEQLPQMVLLVTFAPSPWHIALAHSSASRLAERMQSTRPSRNRRVEALSYVLTRSQRAKSYLSTDRAASRSRRSISGRTIHSSRSGGGRWDCCSCSRSAVAVLGPSFAVAASSMRFRMPSSSCTTAMPSDGECS